MSRTAISAAIAAVVAAWIVCLPAVLGRMASDPETVSASTGHE